MPPATDRSVKHTDQAHKHQEVLRFADELYSKSPDWLTFYREVFGLDGIVRAMFPTREALAEFETTETCRQLHQMLAQLRKKGPPRGGSREEVRVLTVRVPASLHEALLTEAYEHRTSINKLCISKLIQYIDHAKVPSQVREPGGKDGPGVDV